MSSVPRGGHWQLGVSIYRFCAPVLGQSGYALSDYTADVDLVECPHQGQARREISASMLHEGLFSIQYCSLNFRLCVCFQFKEVQYADAKLGKIG